MINQNRSLSHKIQGADHFEEVQGGIRKLMPTHSDTHFNEEKGKLAWEWTAALSQKSDSANAIHITSDDHIFVTGTYGAWSKNDGDVWVARLKKSGSLTWFKRFDANNSWDFGRSIAEAPNGDLLIAGAAKTSRNESANHHGWVFRIDQDGNQIWSKFFGGDPRHYHSFSSVFSLSDGGAILLGVSHPHNGRDASIWLLRISSVGGIVWEKHISPDFMTRDGNLSTYNLIVDNDEIIFSADFGESWILKYTLDGGLVWRHAFRQPGSASIHSIETDERHNIIAVGSVFPSSDDPSSAWILKIDKDGALVWEKLYSRLEPTNVMLAVCIDENGNIEVAGFSGEPYMGEADGWRLSLDGEGVKIFEETVDFKLEDRIRCISCSSNGCLVGAGTTTENKNGKKQAWVHKFT